MNRQIYQIELEHELRLAESQRLSVFRRNAATWELLLRLAADEEEASDGLYNLAARVQTDHLSSAALLKFMRDQRHAGRLLFEPHVKRSKWRVRLEDDVLEELQTLIALRNQALMNVQAVRSRRDKPAGPQT